MSTIAINYELKTLKVKTTPGMPTAEVLEKAATHFKLPPSNYGLFHNKTELPKSLPWRLQNLPTGAKLELKPSKSSKSAEITFKVQFINNPSLTKQSVIKKLSNTTTLKNLASELEGEVGKFLNQGLAVKFATMTKTVGEEEFDKTLSQIGVENNGVLRVSFTDINAPKLEQPKREIFSMKKKTEEKEVEMKDAATATTSTSTPSTATTTAETPAESPKPAPTPTTTTQEPPASEPAQPQPLPSPTPDKMEIDTPAPAPEPTAELEPVKQHVYVFKPADAPVTTEEPAEEIYEMDVSQARQYQTMLARKAHETAKEKRQRLAKQHVEPTSIEVRITFPDGSTLQVNFLPQDTGKTLYEFVRGCLDRKEEFGLCVPYPRVDILEDDTRLGKVLAKRNKLLFVSERKTGVFLKEEYLQQAKDITEAEDVKLDHDGGSVVTEEVETGEIKNGVLPKKPNSTFSSSDSGKKIPKWLKLGKK